eukprot:Hpha_TRINITY_DN16472_c0_g2::TRINITY_DN16472_c0_g2_i1::g.160606::m.160606
MMRRKSSFFRELDGFRRLSADLAEPSVPGGLFTVSAVVVCCILLSCEWSAFMDIQTRTELVIDRSSDRMLAINFDVALHDLACDYVSVGVMDSFGTDRLNITSHISKQKFDHHGVNKGHFYTEEELEVLDLEELDAAQREELDSDWLTSADHHKHDSFERVIQAHDFTFVFFYVRPTKRVRTATCVPCKAWRPVWTEFENIVNEGREEVTRVLRDADGRKPVMRALHINCADFQDMCTDQKVLGFPTIRLYRRSFGHLRFTPFTGPREMEGLLGFMRQEVGKVHTHREDIHVHSVFKEGCRVRGFVEVARVPGTLHFEARHAKDHHLNYATTNVSHTVHHLSFGDNGYQLKELRHHKAIPSEFHGNVAPLDGQTFATQKFHQAPFHFLKVVATTLSKGGDPSWAYTEDSIRAYQMTHQYHVSVFSRTETPQAKFSYDLSPVEVVVSRERGRHWYDFVTCVLAGIGGTFSTFALFAALSGGLGRTLGFGRQ